MSDPKDTTSFFRKVVKFVANPTTEWAELGAPTEDARETEYAKGELKAMIERKRRNDFVRKREFDMLRKVRREGLTSEQLAALGSSSRIDDSEGKMADTGVKADSGVKAKIDEIEQQMVGGDAAYAARRTPEFYNAPTEPAAMEMARARATSTRSGVNFDGARVEDFMSERAVPMATSPVVMGGGVSPLSAVTFDAAAPDLATPFAQEMTEIAHDPELDEAVIAFANADFEQCEQALAALTGPGGARAQHAETWLVLFDLYRAIGQQHRFESLALDYAQQFGWSAPQWFSLPRLVAEAASEDRPRRARVDGQVGWNSPEHIDAEAVAKLASVTLQMPLPWVFDWSALRSIDAEACARLSELFRSWIGQDLDMRWLGGERLFAVLAEAAPTGARDADPAYWQLRLDALRMTNRPDQFDEAAIDYCVTYEVSPPSWEPACCQVRISNPGATTTSPPMSVVSDVSTSFVESRLTEDTAMVQVGTVELSGQLVGDIGPTLKKMDAELGPASIVNVSCARLIRVDFIAAGDLLNWVLARRSENRSVRFVEAHRMVALFFGAMGINEHAKVKVRIV
ncbi:MAG TPA: STAS domain-containing protein [Burkholderiaceae bacterium]|nr:STAS domain-containing protein [Burkholderiaceae bacterium]